MTGPRAGSRVSALLAMEVGDELFFKAETGNAARLMQQISTDIGRAGLRGEVTQSLIVGVELATREVFEIVRVHRGNFAKLKETP